MAIRSLRKRRQPTLNAFEAEFALEALRSGLLRVRILIGAFGSAMLFGLALAMISPAPFVQAFHGSWLGFVTVVSAVGGTNLLLLSLEYVLINRLVSSQKKAPEILNYVSAFIETSLPTAGMLLGSRFSVLFTHCSRRLCWCIRYSLFFQH